MFIVEDDPQFTHTVKVRVPVDGGFEEQSCKATFRVIPADEAATFDLSDGASSTEFLKRALVALDELGDKNGKHIPYNDALRDKLLGRQYFRVALARTYFDAVSPARAGN